MEFESRNKNGGVSALIITPSGAFLEGLKVLLAVVYPNLELGVAAGMEAGLAWIKTAPPRLVMIDCAAFPDAGVAFFQQVRLAPPQVKCLAFVDTLREQHVFQKMGMDGVLFKGFTSLELKHVLEALLTEEAGALSPLRHNH